MSSDAGPALSLPVASDLQGDLPSEELAHFFWYSHDVLVVMDDTARVLAISPSAERVLGHPVDEILGERLIRLAHPDDQPSVQRQLEELLPGRTIEDLDARMSGADGAWVPMRWSLSMGHAQKLYAIGRDYTDQALHQDTLLQSEISELRLRTAMELHDGILQTLTGASLQIAVARKLMKTDPEAADRVLSTLGRSVSAEQQEMRLYVDELKGRAPVWIDGSRELPERIEAVLERLSSVWEVSLSVDARIRGRIAGELGRQILRIVQEATVNAARHGGASSVSVSVDREGSDVMIAVSDDGHGFSFLGEFDHETLKEQRLGPLSLKHRVEETGGSISIRSTTDGSTVFVRVPLPPKSSTP